MEIAYDPAKNAKNIRDRRLSFDDVALLDWGRAAVWKDGRKDYGEVRYAALVPMEGRLHFVCYARRGAVRHIISFRKANRREEKIYAQKTAH